MSSPVQAHSKAIWRDSALGALVNQPSAMYLKRDGSDVVLSADRPENFAFFKLDADDWLLDLTPVYLIFDGLGDIVLSSAGPAAAILVADGADIAISTDLTQSPVADLYADLTGDTWVVPRSASRLDAVQVGDDVTFY
jgi:hypothetical protein